MAISYIPKTNKKEIEVEGYGKFYIRRYGAGEELQIQANLRELDNIQEGAKKLHEALKDKKEEEVKQEDRDKLAEFMRATDRLTRELYEIRKGTFSSDTDGAVDKLFAELPREEIVAISNAAFLEEDKGEKVNAGA